MNETVISYSLYLILAVGMTVWVARTLHKNGRIFLVDCFNGNTDLADSVNHLLVVGFYLMNIGFVSLYLKSTDEISGARGGTRNFGWRQTYGGGSHTCAEKSLELSSCTTRRA